MTHDELLAKVEREKNFLKTQCYEGSAIGTFSVVEALRAVVEYAKELSKTDYRGNPPVEHYISAKLIQIIEKELA